MANCSVHSGTKHCTLGKPCPASVKDFNLTQPAPGGVTFNLVHQSQNGEKSDIRHYRKHKVEELQNTHLATQVVRAWQAIAQNGTLNELQDPYVDGLLTVRNKQPHHDWLHALAAKSKIKSKDCLKVDGIIPPPKGIQGMLKHELMREWQASIANEKSYLTEMGTITHLHTAAALKELGIDIDEMAPAHTHMVFDNKIKPDAITNQATLDKLKSRMMVDGRQGVMKK